ncbi:MAG TPA: hypothetical protein VLF89_07070 [Candidatus Saccharimonadales bacterium]|nr:hypothetical protein [Candidatus Saccharimonadales bacterium]
MNLLFFLVIGAGMLFSSPAVAFAASNSTVAQFTTSAVSVLITIASLASAFFLIHGGFKYITSTGKPQELESAKKTIRNALIGLILVIAAGVFSALLQNAFTTPSNGASTAALTLKPIQTVAPSNGLAQAIIDAVTGFMQAIVQSATKPLVDGIIGFLTTTPSLVANSVVFNFWLVIVGIVDSLFAIVIALLGFHVMSASTFGFDEVELNQLLPRIGLAFLLANTSIFVIDWVISICNMLIQVVLASTGGIDHAWVLQAVNPVLLVNSPGTAALITLIFMLLFVVLAIMLLIFYISRLIVISVGAVLSPFIFLLWVLPGFTDFATIAMKSYIITLFTVFIHVVIIQLASSFLTLPGQSGTNSVISILVGVATFFTLLKVPAMLVQLAFYSASGSVMRKIGGQIIHVFTSSKSETGKTQTTNQGENITPRKTVAL